MIQPNMRGHDSVDEQLVKLLGEDGEQNSEVLAKRLKISSATVRRRLRRLRRDGSLRIVGVVEPSKFGFPLAAMVALHVDVEHLETALAWLTEQSEIRWVSTTTGRFDIITLARFRSTDDLSDFMMKKLRQVQGLQNSETFLCLDVRKGRYGPLYVPS